MESEGSSPCSQEPAT